MIAGTALAFSTPASASTTWPTYHATPNRQGVDLNEQTLFPSTQAWRASLDGAVYGQPVVANGLIYAATENDTVYALSAHDGHIVWHRNVGTPLRSVGAATGCGDIDPLGITSTPVIDPGTGTVYVVAEVAVGSGAGAVVHHQLIGLDPSTGAVALSTNADPPIGSVPPAGQSTRWLQQRGALAVTGGRVYVTYGGLAGDCGIYHGWVVGVEETAPGPNVSYNATPGGQGGAIWGPSGASIGPAGNIFVSTGNPNNPQNPPVGDSESAVKLGPRLHRLAAFRDTRATYDADLATNGVTVLPNNLVFAVGKTDVGYLLQATDLALVAAIPGVCGGDPDGGNAYDASSNTLYVPCRNGTIQPVNLTTHSVKTAISGVNGPPILVNGRLWAVSYPGTSLFQIDPATGAKLQTLNTGSAVPSFASPSAADGLVLIGTTTGVTAFAGPGGPPAAAIAAPVLHGAS
jgi:outer membrane protein assembly factor BamB